MRLLIRPSKWWLLAAVAVAAGCGTQRPSDFAPVCPKFDAEIAPVLANNCANCHTSSSDGGWVIGSYPSVMRSSDEDVARVVPGDNESLVLKAARGELAGHQAVKADDQALLEKWVVQCEAEPDPTQYHPTGWGSPASQAFHGSYLRDGGYITVSCRECHGEDLRGGKSNVDCNSCHKDGPFSCSTCHGDETSNAPPKALNGSRKTSTLGVGAHRTHVLDSELHLAYGCEKCHPNVTDAEQEGHYRFGNKFVADQPVMVLAAFPDAGVTASWDPASATCTNVACHNPNPQDTKATHNAPKWTNLDGSEDKCGTCHGLGPEGHHSDRCEACHDTAYADGGVNLQLHANGKIDLNDGTVCNVCHAPPGTTDFFDTHGDHDAGSPSVGAHTAHLVGGRLRGPLGCPDCHIQPKTAFDPGHVDTDLPAEVFPAGWDGGLAQFDGTTPTFDYQNLTCGSVYCHGAGNSLVSQDQTAGLIRNPVWNGTDQAKCGACHGLPPQDGRFAHTMVANGLDTCVQCHALSVLGDGGIKIDALPDGGMTSHHMDGVVNGNN